MTVRIHGIRLHVESTGPVAGFAARFNKDLVIVRGKNTVGKSLLLQAVLYGLGMEALFATRKGVLTRAMTSTIDLDHDSLDVISSWVEVVVSNGVGQLLTIRRAVRTPSGRVQETDLVRIWQGDLLVTDGSDEARPSSNDYFAARRGAATEMRGFHTYLAEFLGWELPQVPTHDERFVPLYLQVIFGLSYVDQKRGWGGIVPQVPTQFAIIEPLRRAVEFALDLDVLKVAQQRQALLEASKRLRSQETRLRGRLEAIANLHGARVTLPALPEGDLEKLRTTFDADAQPKVEVLTGETWVALSDRIAELRTARGLRSRQAVLSSRVDPSDAAQSEQELREAERALAETSSRVQSLNGDEELLHMQLGALGRRLSTIDDEYRKYGQLATLRSLGSQIAAHSMDDDCPTCHQPLDGVESVEGNALPAEETRLALSQDRATVRNLISEAENRLATIDARRNAWTREQSDLRSKIRAIKSDLTAADGTPSSEVIQRAVQEEQELSRLTILEAQYLEDAETWNSVRANLYANALELALLGPGTSTDRDAAKLATWTAALRRQLDEYGFQSARPDDVDLDAAMKPTVDGYDIGFQGSASDGIRLRWAYLISLLETCASNATPHPGLLMMDEPGQQGVEASALGAMYAHAQATSETSGQLFLTTSEPREQLNAWLGDADYTLIDLTDERLLQAS